MPAIPRASRRFSGGIHKNRRVTHWEVYTSCDFAKLNLTRTLPSTIKGPTMSRVFTFLLLITLALPSSAMGGKQRRLQRKAARQAASCASVYQRQCLRPGQTIVDSKGNKFYVDQCCRLVPIAVDEPPDNDACPTTKLGTVSGPTTLCLWLVEDCANGTVATIVGDCGDPCVCNEENKMCEGCTAIADPGELNLPPEIAATGRGQNMRTNERLRNRRFKLLFPNRVYAADDVSVRKKPYLAEWTDSDTPGNRKIYFELYVFGIGEPGSERYFRVAIRTSKRSRPTEPGEFEPLIVTGRARSAQEGRLTVDGEQYHAFGRVGN